MPLPVGIMHRDIKADNCLLTDDKQSSRLADFGFAMNFWETRPDVRLGTLDYMVGRGTS